MPDAKFYMLTIFLISIIYNSVYKVIQELAYISQFPITTIITERFQNDISRPINESN